MEEPKYRLNEILSRIFQRLKPYFDNYSQDISFPENTQMFKKVLKATVIKSFEFNSSINSLRGDHIYFMMPSLRGICEEYIVERFIAEHFKGNQDNILQLWMQCDIYESSIVQWQYFEKVKPGQILFYKADFPEKLENVKDEIRNEIKKKLHNFKINKNAILPSVYSMAKECNLLEFYNYLYHATSNFVHFNPRQLVRMGWGDLPEIQFSTANFTMYYNDFTCFYSALLFCELCDWLSSVECLPDFDSTQINEVRDILAKEKHWPELVTFEEMNIGAFSRFTFYDSPNSLSS